MTKVQIILFAMLLGAGAAFAQTSIPVKMLTPAECALISKRSETEFFVKGPVKIGGLRMTGVPVTPGAATATGVDTFDVISRSCFNGKPN
jgi:hypothetical protein